MTEQAFVWKDQKKLRMGYTTGSCAAAAAKAAARMLFLGEEIRQVSLMTPKGIRLYLDVEDILPLLTCLSGSMTQGLSVISEMKVNNSLVPLMVEILKVKSGMASFKLSLSDTHKVRAQLNGVNVDTLTQFIYRVAALPKLSRTGLISAFLQSHTDSSFLSSPPSRTEVLQAEMQQKMEAPKQGLAGAARPQAPSIQDLLQRGVVLGD